MQDYWKFTDNLGLRKIADRFGTEEQLASLNVNWDIIDKSVNDALTKIAKDSPKYFVSIDEFPRIAPETTDSPRITRAIASIASTGGVLVFKIAEYLINTTISLAGNITILGQGYSKFQTGTTFKYTGGTGACFNFGTTGATAGIKLTNFRITASSSDAASYQKFTGIDVNRAEWTTISDVSISNANVGIDMTGSTGSIYLLKVDNIFISNCLNEGIYLRSTGSWKNGVHIIVGDISDNGIAIRCAIGQGNVIEGRSSEIGRNRTGGILIEGGVWTIKGSLWIENNPYGVKTTGGHTIIEGDIYNIDDIINEGGSLDVDRKQSHTGYLPPTQIKKALSIWYSFEEGSGTSSFDRVSALKGTFTLAPIWNSSSKGYGTTAETPTSGTFTIPNTKVDWSKDWTLMMLGYGNNNSFFLYCGDATNRFVLRAYPNGTQLSVNGSFAKNFANYTNGDATVDMNWHIVVYDSTAKKMKTYSPTGKLMDTYDVDLSATSYVSPASLYVGALQVIDELIVYNRQLGDTEIRAITQMSIPPDVKKQDFNILASPDGSRWKQVIDNSGVPTWTKL
jgi:hypothetical protein